jgi:nitroimidazol reductase NimA-like FMN-containing flavoprotein (pyridoxamine 5'-phosphate oxidase superfamily)
MRRKDREITDFSEIEEIIKKGQICRIGLCENGVPYVVPLCYGYEDRTLYFHCALEGRKLDIIRRNNNVCFEVETDVEFIKHETAACKWGFKYRSVIGFGKASFVEGLEEKLKAYSVMMGCYSEKKFQFDEEEVNRSAIIRIDIEKLTGKRSGY